MLQRTNKKLIWLTENYPPSRGGMSQSCDRIIYGLRRRGFFIHVVHFTNRREPYKTDNLENGAYTAIPVSESEAHSANLGWNFIEQLPHSFDKIVAFGGYMPLITAPVYSKWLNLPLVTLVRGNDFDTSLFNPRRRSLLDNALHSSESIGCVTRDQVIKIKKLYPGLKPCYTPNGIDVKSWQVFPSERQFAEQWRQKHLNGRLCIGVFGQLKEKKGLEVLIECFKKSAINKRFFLLLTGEYADTLQEDLTVLNAGFELLGFMDRNELVRYYTACDLIAIPSHYEGMPNTLLEAGALGRPVIASAVGGMKDVLADFGDSFLFPPGKTILLEMLLLKISEMATEELDQHGMRLKNHIIKNYNSDKELDPYIEIFNYEKDPAKSMA